MADCLCSLCSCVDCRFALGCWSRKLVHAVFFVENVCRFFPNSFLLTFVFHPWWQTVVFCLVDIYIMLGKAFLPHLEGLNSTQLRLVTIYANRISQARTGAPIDAGHD